MRIIGTIFILLFAASAFAGQKPVATCGDYKLLQGESTGYFAGIAHTQNSYILVDGNGENHYMDFKSNSEGAVLTSSYIPDGLTIVAMWRTFELSITDEQGNIEKVVCEIVKAEE